MALCIVHVHVATTRAEVINTTTQAQDGTNSSTASLCVSQPETSKSKFHWLLMHSSYFSNIKMSHITVHWNFQVILASVILVMFLRQSGRQE